MQIELRHIKTMLLLDELGSLRQAAAALRLSQQAVATQLHRVEQAIGAPLFDRDGATLRLTRLGRHFISGARRVLVDFEALRHRSAELTRASDTPQVRLVGPVNGLEDLVDGCRQVLPDHRITTEDLSMDRILASLADGQADIVLTLRYRGRGPRPAAEVTCMPIVEREPAFVGMRTDHRLANQDELNLADLADEEWIIASPNDRSGRYESFRQACRHTGFEPRTRHNISECRAMLHMIRSGLGIGLVSPLEPTPEGLVHKALTGTPQHRDQLLCWRTDSPLAEAAERVSRRMAANYLRKVGAVPRYRDWWLRHRGPLDVDTRTPEAV